jgi:hypothetical protein
MESKIEKLERVKPMALMGMMGEVAPQWVAKELNRIIDHLNSQAQPEENKLDKAREEGRREGSEITSRYISDFVKSESGKSGRKEILEYIEELSKLKQ